MAPWGALLAIAACSSGGGEVAASELGAACDGTSQCPQPMTCAPESGCIVANCTTLGPGAAHGERTSTEAFGLEICVRPNG
ncbi:MAG: hypothetical protein HY908_37435 [Myxococcales bacterium]|nr:hypothetical protein [Myxococcales bacterium]